MKGYTLRRIVLLGLFAVLTSTVSSYAQMFILHDVNGRPIRKGIYENVIGSPYFSDEWSKGDITLANGNTYEGVMIKFDLIENVLLFQNKEGEPMELVHPVHTFSIKGGQVVFRNGFPPVDNFSSNAFFQVLIDDDVKLLKKTDKVIREEKAYGTATITKKIIENTNYYVVNGNQITKVKNFKTLSGVLPGKEEVLKNYIDEKRLSLKNEKDLIIVVKYYNSLSEVKQ